MRTEVIFKIDSYTPRTLPMWRLGEYLLELAELYGERSSVHFKTVRRGSALLVSEVDDPAVPKVRERIARARRIDAPQDLGRAYERIDRMLADDNAKGSLRVTGREATVIAFPGREREQPIDFGSIRQPGFLDGELVRIGGRDKTVHVQLQDGDILHTNIVTDRETARRLARLIFGPTVRLSGVGTWRRDESGMWIVESFRVSSFEVLSDGEDLAAEFEKIDALGGNYWRDEDDPVAALLRLRGQDGE